MPSDIQEMSGDFLVNVRRLRMQNDICYAFKEITGKDLYQYQRDFLLSTARFHAINKSRQTGMTFVASFKKFWLTWTGKSESEIIISVSKRASDTVMRYIKDHARAVGETEKTAKVWNADQITWENNCSIFSLPQAPSTIRSLHGNVFMDECAHYERAKEIKEAALPFLSRGYGLDASTTPRGMDQLFYESFWTNDNFTQFNIPWTDCPDLTEENLRPIRESMDEDSWRQEYECEFIDEAHAYFPYSLIMSRVNSELEVYRKVVEGRKLPSLGISDPEDILQVVEVPEAYVFGMDVGRVKDATEFIFLDEDGRVVAMVTMKGVPFRFQLAYARACMRNVARACFDSSGLGMNMVEDLRNEFGTKAGGITFSRESKERMATNLHIAFEPEKSGPKATIPNNSDLINQIHSIKRLPSATGIRFDVEKNDKHHGDMFWALALAWEAGFLKPKAQMNVVENNDLDSVI